MVLQLNVLTKDIIRTSTFKLEILTDYRFSLTFQYSYLLKIVDVDLCCAGTFSLLSGSIQAGN